jgi:hypothetical protein
MGSGAVRRSTANSAMLSAALSAREASSAALACSASKVSSREVVFGGAFS